jgi:hypothetical protein
LRRTLQHSGILLNSQKIANNIDWFCHPERSEGSLVTSLGKNTTSKTSAIVIYGAAQRSFVPQDDKSESLPKAEFFIVI